jgi:hypothetical protein
MALFRSSDAKKQKVSSPDECTYGGVVVTVTKNVEEFIHIVLEEGTPLGLFVAMKDFHATYGHLLCSVPNYETLPSNPFQVSTKKGPCRLFCSGCEKLVPDSVQFRLPNGMGETFGAKPVRKCPNCGCKNAVIVFIPKEAVISNIVLEAEKVECSNCGETILSTYKYCEYCGVKI